MKIVSPSYKKNISSNCIYLDNAASTQIDNRVLDAINSVLSGNIVGNPHSKHHIYGSTNALIVQDARARIAACINAQPEEIVFTSGATEANNLVIKGLAHHLRSSGKTHVITTAVEHKSILEPLSYLADNGFDVTVLPVKPCGMVDASMVEKVIGNRTGLICIQSVNNETGTIQPLAEIIALLGGRDILFHSDAAQALGKIDFSVNCLNVDFASISAHKMHGPQGIGVLYVRADKKDLLKPLHSGGGQQFGLRSGTVPVALCAGFGVASSLIENKAPYLQKLRTAFLSRISLLNPNIYGHHDPNWNVPGILSIRFPGIDSETLTMALPGLAFGIGSACSSESTKLSHVIKAITNSEQAARETIRLSFGCLTTSREMDAAADQIISAITEIRKLQGVV